MQVQWIDDTLPLPDPRSALGPDTDLAGLVAAGGRVTPQRLQEAYSQGIFPWYSPGQPALWWSPDPRMVLKTADLHLPQSLKKTLRQFRKDPRQQLRFDTAFERVLMACANTPRAGQDGTWIVPAMMDAYIAWHQAGVVHSVETWQDGELTGGLYFVCLGRMCFGESMFAHRADASKIALAAFVAACRARGVAMVDCQQNTAHLARFGAREISRADFLHHLNEAVAAPAVNKWSYDETAWELLS
jgi:leucyl/phenylalanyl-tRNA---protein transferase